MANTETSHPAERGDWLDDFNARVHGPLEAERHNAVADRARIIREGAQAADAMPNTAGIVNSVHAAKVGNSNLSTDRIQIRGAIAAAVLALGHEIVAYSQVPEAQRAGFWAQAARRTIASGAIGALTANAFRIVEKALLGLGPSLKAFFGGGSLPLLAEFANCATTGAAAVVTTGSYIFNALYHLVQAGVAKLRGDNTTYELEMRFARQNGPLEIGLRTLSVVAGLQTSAVVSGVAVGLIGTGIIPAAISMCTFTLCQALSEALFVRAKVYGGWLSYLATWFFTDRRRRAWVGTDLRYDIEEHRVTDALRCPLTVELVVDPVRSNRTGTLYERRAIEKWVLQDGRDPLTREKVTVLDYPAAPVARRYAHEIAARLAAVQSPVRD
ncbi:hypothetical protein ACM66B_001735 [Microbotryomycetes sp. NB124-2]